MKKSFVYAKLSITGRTWFPSNKNKEIGIMKRTLIGILLVVCLVVGLLPITALADNTAKIMIMASQELSVTEGGAPAYLKNKEVDLANKADGSTTFKGWTQEPGDKSNWNVKFEWPQGGIPTVTLKDAKFDYYDNTTETYAYVKDSSGNLVSTANRTTQDIEGSTMGGTEKNLLVGAIMPVKGCNIDLKVVLKGNNMVETGAGFVHADMTVKENFDEYMAGTYNDYYFKNLTFVGEGENKTVVDGGGIGIHTKGGYDVSFENVNLDISTTVKGSNAIPIHVTEGNLTITGGHLKVKNMNNIAVWTKNGGDIIINGDITVENKLSSTSGASGIYAKKGEVIVNGGKIVGTGHNCPIFNALDAVIINGGDLKLTSAYYAIYPTPGAKFEINGGTIEVMAERAFFSAPTVSSKVTGYAGSSANSCENWETDLKHKPWVFLSDDTSKLPEVEIEIEDPTVPSTLPPTGPGTVPTVPTTPTTPSTPATTPTTPVATKPAGNATQAPGGDETKAPSDKTDDNKADDKNTGNSDSSDEDEGGSNAIIWIAVVVVVLAAGGAIAFILIKRKKA